MKTWQAVVVWVVVVAALGGCGKGGKKATASLGSMVALRQQVGQLGGEVEAGKALAQPGLDEVDDVATAFSGSPFPAPGAMEAARVTATEIKAELGRLEELAAALRTRVTSMPDRVPQQDVVALQGELDGALAALKALEGKKQVLRGHVDAAREVLDSHRVNTERDSADEIRAKIEAERLVLDAEQKRLAKAREAVESKAAEAARQEMERQRVARPHDDND